jgi:hypothetical protein
MPRSCRIATDDVVRRFFAILAILALVLGVSYASALLFRVMGPWTALAIQADSSQVHMAFSPDLPRPEWVPIYPGATVVQSSRLTSGRMPSGFHSLDLATRASFEDVKRFYLEHLSASGFAVVDNGLGPLSPLTASFLGIAGSLSARRVATDDQIDIVIGTPDGLIPSRPLKLHWRKISEGAAAAAGAL